jgi:hypothetical protein
MTTSRVKETAWETTIIAAHLWEHHSQWPTDEQLDELQTLLDSARTRGSVETHVWRMQTAFGCERGTNGTSKLDFDIAELFRSKPDVMMALAHKLRELTT